jgi:hypothetical protein
VSASHLFTSLPCAQDTGGENPCIDTQGGLKASDCGRLGRQAAACCAQQTGMHILVVEALLIATYFTRDEQVLIHIRKPCRSRTCLVRIASPCPAVPVQLVPAQLGLSLAGPYQLWCTSLRIATDTRPTRNTGHPWSALRVVKSCRKDCPTLGAAEAKAAALHPKWYQSFLSTRGVGEAGKRSARNRIGYQVIDRQVEDRQTG